MNKRLVLTIFCGLILHALSLYFLHHSILNPPARIVSSPLLTIGNPIQVIERHERTLLLSNQISEGKKDFNNTELALEFAPTPQINFSVDKPIFSSSDDFATQDIEVLKTQSEPAEIPFFSQTLTSPPVLAANTQEEGHVAEGDYFFMQVEYAHKQNRPGYVFKIILTAKPDVPFKRIRQNYFFLIDRSNSIPRARFALNKKAVQRALQYLQPGDTFNILLFDNRVVRLADENLVWNDQTLALAQSFLETQGHGGYFATTDLYSSLGKIIPRTVSDKEANTVILLSDGDTFLSMDKQRQTIGEWTHHNQGKVSLFSIATGSGNNLALLDLLSSFNKGILVYTSQHLFLEERLIQLIQSIQHPIGKNMIATPVALDRSMVVVLQPKNCRLPDLYKSRPFVIYGSINKLDDFALFLQGKFYDRGFDIKKMVSFSDARLSSSSIEREWTQLFVQDYYEQFIEDGKPKHLESAMQYLAPLNLPVPLLKK